VRTRDAQLGPEGRGLLLLPAAVIAVHQLRYWLAYGPRASAQLAAQGHSYLHSLVPWAIFALAAAGGLYLRRLATAARTAGAGDIRRRSALALWLATFAGLLVAYAAQELLEGALATGHPAGVGGVLGHGGWWAIPAAAVVAAVVAALLLLGRALLRIAAAPTSRRIRALAAAVVPAGVHAAVVRPLARAAAGRAPPLRLLPR
jgi:cation transport ATPase